MYSIKFSNTLSLRYYGNYHAFFCSNKSTHLASGNTVGRQLYTGEAALAQSLAVHNVPPQTLNFLSHDFLTDSLYSIPEINPDQNRKIPPCFYTMALVYSYKRT